MITLDRWVWVRYRRRLYDEMSLASKRKTKELGLVASNHVKPHDRVVQVKPVTGVLVVTVLLVTGCPDAMVSVPARQANTTTEQQTPVSKDTSPDINELKQRIDTVLDENLQQRRLSVSIHGGWQILHGILAYGHDFNVEAGGDSITAIDYLLAGAPIRGVTLQPGDMIDGRRGIRVPLEPATKMGQGHRDQWLAILAQTNLLITTELVLSDGSTGTIGDWLRQTEHDIPLNAEREFSWTLIGLLAYRPTDHRWTARDGLDYSIESLLKSELRADLSESVCGGTHRLNAISAAVSQRQREGKPLTGVWSDAVAKLGTAASLARQNQNPDGSFSTNYFHRTGWARDLGEQLGTTGHVLEFLALKPPTQPDSQPYQQLWIRRCAERLCDLLIQCREIDLECGVLYHALHGLRQYRNRLN
ncbi:MAG: ADP-ribosylation factor-directed GTPase activating protein isoform b [Planctomycetota bacterium]